MESNSQLNELFKNSSWRTPREFDDFPSVFGRYKLKIVNIWTLIAPYSFFDRRYTANFFKITTILPLKSSVAITCIVIIYLPYVIVESNWFNVRLIDLCLVHLTHVLLRFWNYLQHLYSIEKLKTLEKYTQKPVFWIQNLSFPQHHFLKIDKNKSKLSPNHSYVSYDAQSHTRR